MLAPEAKTLLDVGCRDGKLKKFLPAEIGYAGIDLTPGPHVTKVCNAESGIPYPDNAFDVIVALDMLEHTDNIWYVFDEFVRVARRQIMVVLPNSYHWKARLRFLRGKEGDKYKLSPEPIEDRHRWLTSYDTSRTFATHMARKYGLRVTESIAVDEGQNITREALAQVFSPNFMSIAVFFTFEKPTTG
jgi:hypothetical protein